MGLLGQQLRQRDAAHVERPAMGGYQAEAVVEAGVEYGGGQGSPFAVQAHPSGRDGGGLPMGQRNLPTAEPLQGSGVHHVAAVAADVPQGAQQRLHFGHAHGAGNGILVAAWP